jgi:Domain of unknown function (DUF4389)
MTVPTRPVHQTAAEYPVQFFVDYPARPLNRLTTLIRPILALPILIVLVTISGGPLFLSRLLMILFRRKYPQWWFDWNLELHRLVGRVAAYLALMDDRYPSTDDQQSVRLTYPSPDNLNRWLPLVKWLLAIPHHLVLAVLDVAMIVVVLVVWFAILFTGAYPRGLFGFVEGVLRWHNRVTAYSFTLVTDRYPPFRLSP